MVKQNLTSTLASVFILLGSSLVAASSFSCELGDEVTKIEVQYKSGFFFSKDNVIQPNGYKELVSLPKSNHSKHATLMCGGSTIEFLIAVSTIDSRASQKITPSRIAVVNETKLGNSLVFNTIQRPSASGAAIQSFYFCQPGSTITFKSKSLPLPGNPDAEAASYEIDCKMADFAVDFSIQRNTYGSGIADACQMLARPYNVPEGYYVNVNFDGAICDFDNPDLGLHVATQLFKELLIIAEN